MLTLIRLLWTAATILVVYALAHLVWNGTMMGVRAQLEWAAADTFGKEWATYVVLKTHKTADGWKATVVQAPTGESVELAEDVSDFGVRVWDEISPDDGPVLHYRNGIVTWETSTEGAPPPVARSVPPSSPTRTVLITCFVIAGILVAVAWVLGKTADIETGKKHLHRPGSTVIIPD